MPNKVLISYFKFSKSSTLFFEAYKHYLEIIYLNGHEDKEITALSKTLTELESLNFKALQQYLAVLHKIGKRKDEAFKEKKVGGKKM
jgi:hypothetical protein